MVLPGALKYKDRPSKWGANLRHDLTRRSMSNHRLVFTVLSLLLAIFMSYASFFYLPAYVSGASVLKISSQSASYPSSTSHKKNQTVFDRYLDYLIMNRGYLTKGQAVKVRYARSADTQLTLVASRCAGPMIWEIFSCKSTEVRRVKAKQINGELTFSVPQNGFYRFNEVATSKEQFAPQFDVIWSRFDR